MVKVKETGIKERSERNYGIDLLRLVLMYMVCILHTLGQGGVLSASTEGTVRYNVFWLIEIVSYCAVDGFALISGYTAKNKPLRFSKIVEMWFQAVFYSFVVTVLLNLVFIKEDLTASELIKAAFPVTHEKFWYFTAYFALFFAIPVLNKFIFSIDETTAKTSFIVMILLYSVMGTIADPFKSHNGYSAIWLMVLYCIGALSKKIKLFEKRNSVTLIMLWMFAVLFTWFAEIFFGTKRYINYLSPTVLLSGMIMVVLFARLKIKGTVISKVSPLAFGIYLFQLNEIVWFRFLKDAAVFSVTKNICIGIGYVMIFALAIWLAGLAVDFIRSKIFLLLHISALSGRIATLAEKAIEKVFVLLK